MRLSSNRCRVLCCLLLLAFKPGWIHPADAPDQTSASASPEDLAAMLPRLQPLPPKEALRSFQVEPGFHIELVAAEPDVVDPIDLAFDEQGRMYVAEMRGYPNAPLPGTLPKGRIRLLEDKDNNGQYESVTVFADSLQWPSGIACWKGGIFVSAAPDIIYLKDTDGDGVTDIRRVVFTGFGTRVAEDIVNNLKWGLDFWIYGATSYNGGDVVKSGGKSDFRISVRSRDFRFHPVTGEFQPIGGGRGDYGNCFDDWGNRFVCNAGSVLMHAVFPPGYIDRNPFLGAVASIADATDIGPERRVYPVSEPEPWRRVRRQFWDQWVNTTHDMRASRFSQQELALQGFLTGAAGATIYRGSAFPPEYHGNAFTAEPAGNLIVRTVVESDGVTFRAQRSREEKREFLSSTDNWFRPVNFANGPDGCLYLLDMYRELIEDPSAIPQDILQHLEVNRGNDRGRIFRILPSDHQRRAFPRRSSWKSSDLVQRLSHPDAWWRETAQRLILERQDTSAVSALKVMVQQQELPQARLHALWTLQGLGALDAKTVDRGLADVHPAVRANAVRLAENFPVLHKAVLESASDPDPRVRLQAALSLGGMESREAIEMLGGIAKQDGGNSWMRTAILTLPPDRAFLLLNLLFEPMPVPNHLRPLVSELLSIIGRRADPSETGRVLEWINKRKETQGRSRVELTARLAAGLDDNQTAIRQLPLDDAAVVAWNEIFHSSVETAFDAVVPLKQRTQAVQVLAHADFSRSKASLLELLHPRQPDTLQTASVRAFSTYQIPEVASILLNRWRQFSPASRAVAIEAMFRRADRIPLLLDGMEQGIILTGELDPVRRNALLTHKDPAVQERAGRLFESRTPGEREKTLRSYTKSVAALEGNERRGAEIFENACMICHTWEGKGNAVGPALAGVKNQRLEELLVHILDPNRQVSPNYLAYTLVTTNGEVVDGIIVHESATSVTMRRAGGMEETIARKNIDTLRSKGLSLMPEGLEEGMSPQDMADLIAYLKAPL